MTKNMMYKYFLCKTSESTVKVVFFALIQIVHNLQDLIYMEIMNFHRICFSLTSSICEKIDQHEKKYVYRNNDRNQIHEDLQSYSISVRIYFLHHNIFFLRMLPHVSADIHKHVKLCLVFRKILSYIYTES